MSSALDLDLSTPCDVSFSIDSSVTALELDILTPPVSLCPASESASLPAGASGYFDLPGKPVFPPLDVDIETEALRLDTHGGSTAVLPACTTRGEEEVAVPCTPNITPPTPELDAAPASPVLGQTTPESIPQCACYDCLMRGLAGPSNAGSATSPETTAASPVIPLTVLASAPLPRTSDTAPADPNSVPPGLLPAIAGWHAHVLLLSFDVNPFSSRLRNFSGRLSPTPLAVPPTDKYGRPLPQVHRTVDPGLLVWKIWAFPLERSHPSAPCGESGPAEQRKMGKAASPGAPGGWEGTEWMDRWEGWLSRMVDRVRHVAGRVVQAMVAQFAHPHSASLHPFSAAQAALLPCSYAALARAHPRLFDDAFCPPAHVGKGPWLGHMYLFLYWAEWALRETRFLLALERGLKGTYGGLWRECVGSGSVVGELRERKGVSEMGVGGREGLMRAVERLEGERARLSRLPEGAPKREAHAGLAIKYLTVLAEMVPDVPVPFFVPLREVEQSAEHTAWWQTWEKVHLALSNLIVRSGIDPVVAIYLKNVVVQHPWHTFGFRAVIERDAIAAYTASLPSLTGRPDKHRAEFTLSALKESLEETLSNDLEELQLSPPQEEYTFHQVLSCATDRGEIALCPIEPGGPGDGISATRSEGNPLENTRQDENRGEEDEEAGWFADPEVEWETQVRWKVRTEAGWFWVMLPRSGSRPTFAKPESTSPSAATCMKRDGSADMVKRDLREDAEDGVNAAPRASKRVKVVERTEVEVGAGSVDDTLAEAPTAGPGQTSGDSSVGQTDLEEADGAVEPFDPLGLARPPGAAAWTTASPGLIEHLRYMTHDLWAYARAPEGGLRRLDETERGAPVQLELEFGTHRLPRTRRGRGEVLWAVWRGCVELADGGGSTTGPDLECAVREIVKLRRSVLLRLFQRLKRYALLPTWQRTFQAPADENGDPFSDQGEGYYPTHADRHVVLLKEVLFFLRQAELIAQYVRCWVMVERGLAANALHGERATDGGGLWGRLRDAWRGKEVGSLVDALQAGRDALQRTKTAESDDAAAAATFEGLVGLAPFYPLEYWIAAWEARQTGLTGLHHELLLLLGRMCHRRGLSAEAAVIARTIREHPFATQEMCSAAAALSMPRDTSPLLPAPDTATSWPDDPVHPSEASTFSLQDILRLSLAQGDFAWRHVAYSPLDKDMRAGEVLVRDVQTGRKWVAAVDVKG